MATHIGKVLASCGDLEVREVAKQVVLMVGPLSVARMSAHEARYLGILLVQAAHSCEPEKRCACGRPTESPWSPSCTECAAL
jgi:hypothetical protein